MNSLAKQGICCHPYHSVVPCNLPPDGNSRARALECGRSNCHMSLEKEDGVPLGFDQMIGDGEDGERHWT